MKRLLIEFGVAAYSQLMLGKSLIILLFSYLFSFFSVGPSP